MILLTLLFATGVAAGLVDSIAGGGGVITIPVLLGVGIPPQYALGTNKLQSSFGSGSAMLNFLRSGHVELKECWEGILCTAVGAAVGSHSVQLLDPGFLKLAIPWLLVAIALYTLFTPRLGFEDIRPRFRPIAFYCATGLTIGFYDGFFGPGTGSFWVMALMLGLGYNMKKGTGYTKVMNFTSNFTALVLFIVGGRVLWREGLVMGAGQFLGARVGSRLVITRGTRFVRPIFIAMALAVTARLLYQNYR